MISWQRRAEGMSTRLGVVAIVFFFGLPLFLGLGRIDLRNDEAIYSYAVDSILESGEWLTPHLSPDTSRFGDPHDRAANPFLEKPPLKAWLVAAPIKAGILPHDELGLRFWDALFGTLAFVYLFLIGRRLVDSILGYGAVFLLFIQWGIVFRHGFRANVMEAALVLAYCGGIYHFLIWSESEGRSERWKHILSFSGWLTLGFMTKFVAVVFLPMVAGVAALLVRDWRQRLWNDRVPWLAGACVVMGLSLPWFVYEHFLFGEAFWREIFGRHVYERMVDSLDPVHVQPWAYYLTGIYREMRVADAHFWLVAGVLLWVGDTIRRRWPGGILVLVWLFLPIALLSSSVSKLFHYAFPFLPAAALMAAYPLSLMIRMVRGLPTGFGRLDAFALRVSEGPGRDRVARFLGHRGTRAALSLIAVAAVAMALATLVSGQLELTAFGVSLLHNSSVVRPLMIAALCLVPLASRSYTAAMPVLAVIAFLFPAQRYGTTFERALTIDSPMRGVRDCVVEQFGEMRLGESPGESRLYVHMPPGAGLTHNYYYYFRRLDVWERPELLEDQLLKARLFVEGQQAPTIILEPDYLDFVARLDALEPTGNSRVLPPALMLGVGHDGMTEALILLPGPFATCAEEGLLHGGIRYYPRRPAGLATGPG
jgi:4-amino-4-deoxy-L-arabinose transferase-like glycosyltransferase